MRSDPRLARLVTGLTLLAVCAVRGAAGELAELTLHLKAGANLVSVPLVLDAPQRRLDLLFAGILPQLESLAWFDGATQQWQSASPKAMDWPATTALPDFAGLWLTVDRDLDWHLIGTAPAPGEPVSSVLVSGWQLVGFGLVRRDAQTQDWVTADLTARQLVQQYPGMGLDLEQDAIYAAAAEPAAPTQRLAGEDVLHAGQAYWIQHPAPAATTTRMDVPGGAAQVSGSTPAERAARVETLQQKLATKAELFPTQVETIALGSFTITDVRYRQDGDGNRVSGVGIIRELPPDLAALVALNDDYPFAVEIEFRENRPLGAFAAGAQMGAGSDLTGAVYVAPNRGTDGRIASSARSVPPGALLYLLIAVTDFYPSGYLHVEVETDAGFGGPVAPGYIQAYTPSGVLQDSRSGLFKEDTDFHWARFASVFGQPEGAGAESDLALSEVWTLAPPAAGAGAQETLSAKEQRRQARHATGEWLLNPPESAVEVFEPLPEGKQDKPVSYGYDPREWLRFVPDRSATGGVKRLTMTCTGIQRVQILRRWASGAKTDDLALEVKDGKLHIDEYGSIWFDDAREERQTRIAFRNGRIEFTDARWEHIGFWVLYRRGHLVPTMGFTWFLEPGEYGDGTELKSARLDGTLGLDVILHAQGAAQAGAPTTRLFDRLTAYFRMIGYGIAPNRFGPPSSTDLLPFIGSSFSVGVDIDVRLVTPISDTELAFPMGYQFKIQIIDDKNIEVYHTLRAEVEVQSADVDAGIGAKLFFESVFQRRMGLDHTADERHTIYTGWSVNGTIGDADSPWAGKTLTFADRAKIKDYYCRNHPLLGAVYLDEPVFSFSVADSQPSAVGGDGWNFVIDDARFEGQPFAFPVQQSDWFARTVVALGKHAVYRYKPRAGTRIPGCFFVKRAMINSRLEAPAEMQDTVSGATIYASVEYKDGRPFYAIPGGIESFTFLAEPGYVGGSDELRVALEQVYVTGRPGPPFTLSLAATVQIIWKDRPMTVQGMISREADGSWVFTGGVEDVAAIAGEFEFGRVDSLIVSFPIFVKSAGANQPRGVEWLKRFQFMISGRFDNADIREKLGMTEGIELTGMISFPEGTPRSAIVTLYAGAIPLASLSNLSSEFADIPGFEFEKLSNLTIQASPGQKSYMFNFDVDMVAKAFVPDPDTTPREKWPRLTVGATISLQRDPAGNRLTSIDVRGSNLLSLAFNDDIRGANEEDGGVILKQLRFAIEKGAGRTNMWELDGGIEFVLPNRAVKLAHDALCEIPQHIDLVGKYYRVGERPGWMFGARFGKKVELGGFSLMLNEFIVTKSSPWGFGFNAAVGFGEKTFDGTVNLLADGFKFILPADTIMDLSLPGDVGLAIKNFNMAIGQEFGLGGDVDLSLPQGNPLRAVCGEKLVGRLLAGIPSFEVELFVNAAKAVDMGPLGQAVFAFDAIRATSMGVLTGRGHATLDGHTVGLELGVQGPSVFIALDFGQDGIDTNLAGFFKFGIHNKIAYRCIAGAHLLQIDDATIGGGLIPLSGMEFHTERLYYILPVTLPPVGFAFFDNLEGKTYMCGFAINVGCRFPAPTGQDLLTLVLFLADAFGGGNVNWQRLGELSSPAFGIHDVYLDFPKVPGYTWHDGGWRYTDHIFKTIFNLDRWTFINSIDLTPGTLVRLATADSIYDVADVIIPPSMRQKQGTLDLRGFQASAGYAIRGDRTLFEDHALPKLPALERFVQRVRYVKAHTGEDPTELVLRPELDAWSGHDWEMQHGCGHAEALRPVRNQISFLVRHWLASDEFARRNLTVDAFKTAAKAVFGAAAVDALYARLANPGPITIATLSQELPADTRSLDAAVSRYQLQDRATEAFLNDFYQAFFGRAADAGGRRYWLRTAFGPCPWLATKSDTGTMVRGPCRPLVKGGYQAVFGLRVASRSASGDVVTLGITADQGNTSFASQTLRGSDFQVVGKTENHIVNFTVPANVSDLAFQVATTGATAVTVESIRLLAAGSVVTRQVPIADDLGGGNATVQWQGADIRPELMQLEQLVSDLALPRDKTWDQYLEHVLTRLRKRDASPEVRDRRLLFAWSPDWRVEVELNRGSRGDINAVHWLDGGLRVRCGRAIVYRDPNFAGGCRELTDDGDFAGEPVPSDTISSIKIEGRGSVSLYPDTGAKGTALTVTRDIPDLSTVSFNDVASSALVFLPIKPYEIQGWRLTAGSSSGVVITLDAGAWDALFPAGERVLWMPDTSRLATARGQVCSALDELKPYPTFFRAPQDWLADWAWNRVMLPLKADARVEGDATLVFPRYPPGSRTSSTRPDWTLSARPFTDRSGRTISGLRIDPATGEFRARYGTVTIFGDSNYQGTSTVVTNDLPSLVGTEVGDNAASSIRCEGGGRAELYDLDQYRGWDETGRYALSNVEKRTTNAQAASGAWRFTSVEDNDFMFRYRLTANSVPVRYRFVVTCTLEKADSMRKKVRRRRGLFDTWEVTTVACSDSTTVLRLDLVSADGTVRSVAVRRNQLPLGQPVSLEHVIDVDAAAPPPTFQLHQDWGNSTILVHEPAFIHYMARPSAPVEALSQSDDSLVNNPIGSDRLSSLKVFSPYRIGDTLAYDLSRTLPAGGAVHLFRQNDTPRIGIELTDTRRRIDCRYTDQGDLAVTATTSDNYAFPLAGYTLYARGVAHPLLQLTEAAQHVRVMSQRTQMPEGPLVTQLGGAMRTEFQSVAIEPAGPGEPTSMFELPADNGARLRFLLPPAAGGFGQALVAGSSPEDWWPTYTRDDGLTTGIRRRIGTERGGFFINADLQAGDQDYVQLSVHVSGEIQTDGKFELRGNGELVIADYTVSDAEIVLGSEQGLYIRGRMDLYGIAQVLVEGYLRPDGQFSFTGAASLMVRGTGVKGALTLGNEGLFINGGFYLFDRPLRSAAFAITRGGKISYGESLGIGIAGVDYTVWVQFVQALGLGLEGNAWVDLTVPVRIWAPTDWDHCPCYLVWWPTEWAWITIGTINMHYDAHFGPWELQTQDIQIPFVVGTFKYNMASRQASVDWR